MWQKIASFILRNKLYLIIALVILTVFMGYKATKVEMLYEFGQLLPEDDTTNLEYKQFCTQISLKVMHSHIIFQFGQL